MRLYRNGEVPEGACCLVCGERRRIVLTVGDVGGQEPVLCGNCALVAERTRPRVQTIDELRRLAARERRLLGDRRIRSIPVLDDRRVGARRAGERVRIQPSLDPSID
jgi:hypothetical protein